MASYQPCTIMASSTVLTSTHFLQRDPLYDTEKPYSLRFSAPEGFPRANILLQKHLISVRDIRHASTPPSLKDDGCVLLDDFQTQMQYDDFDNDNTVKRIYLRDVANRLKQLLGAQHVQIFEHTVTNPAI